jgi:4-hydroxy-tetrahydrodipicolinate reductase
MSPMKIALVGYGRMGRAAERAALDAGHEVVARLARGDVISAASLGGADAAVEFSTPDAAADNLISLAHAGVDVACGTTGWEGELDRVRAAVESAGTGLLVAANFSPGVALFTRLVRQAAALAVGAPEYDVHLYEAHHRHKVDHPSGTARVLADTIVAALGRKHRWMEGPPSGPTDPSVLYISVSRAGEIPGTHTVMLEGPHDRIQLRHEARDRGGFARGAVEGVEWIHRRAGVHTLDDWMDDRFGPPSVRP